MREKPNHFSYLLPSVLRGQNSVNSLLAKTVALFVAFAIWRFPDFGVKMPAVPANGGRDGVRVGPA